MPPKAERPSSAAAEISFRAAQPPPESPSAAAPGSASGASRWRDDPAVAGRPIRPRPAPRTPRTPTPATSRDTPGQLTIEQPGSMHGASRRSPRMSYTSFQASTQRFSMSAFDGTPTPSAAERLSSPAAGMANGAVKPADERRSGAAPVRPGRARTTPAARPPGPAPPHLRASCAVAAACAYGASGAMRAACRRRRDCGLRERPAKPPERLDGPRCRKAERPSSPAAETTTGAAQPADEWRSGAAPGSAGRSGPHRAARPPDPARPHLCASWRLRGRPRRTSVRRPSGPRAGGA